LEGPVAREVARRDALQAAVVLADGGVRGTCRGIDAGGRLLIEGASGSLHALSAGSVTILQAGKEASYRS
jgi:hypothetical protein